ncbi:MAG: ATP-binding protein [Bacteroidetes bacterium]|nr:ATP-binding protein [Bacteroidota bacterium]MDA1333262.1 ATP-binding protein [Bacteroidota bacterium]
MSELRQHLVMVVKGKGTGWVLTGLLLAGLLTWGIGKWDVSRAEDSFERSISEQRSASAVEIQNEVDQSFAAIRAEAALLARDPDIVQGLRGLVDAGSGQEQLVRRATRISKNPLRFVEIYDPTPSLQAWSGAAFPVDGAVRQERFMLQVQESVALDANRRTALTVWTPVLDGSTIVGVVRVGEIVERRMPLRNEYLRDYTWGEEWSERLGQPVQFTFGGNELRERADRFVLRSPQDVFVGSVTISAPAFEGWRNERQGRYNDTVLFWLFLAMLFLVIRWTWLLWHIPPDGAKQGLILLSWVTWLVLTRWAFLFLNLPGRWQSGKAPFAPLFDAQHLASVYGWGAMSTIGDLFISAVFFTLVALVVMRVTSPVRRRAVAALRFGSGKPAAGLIAGLILQQLVILAGTLLLFQIAHHTILDSTLDFFERSGLLPGRLVLLVFGSLLMLVFSSILLIARCGWLLFDRLKVVQNDLPSPAVTVTLVFVIYAIAAALMSMAGGLLGPGNLGAGILMPAFVLAIMTILAWTAAMLGPIQPVDQSPIVVLRRIVPLVIVTSLALFPMLEISSTDKIRLRMEEAAGSFLEDRDARAMFAISQVLDAADDNGMTEALARHRQDDLAFGRPAIDSLAESVTTGFMLSALSSYDVTVTLFSEAGRVLGRYSNLARRLPRPLRDAEDETEYVLFRAMYDDFGESGSMIEKLTGTSDQNRFRYAGFRDLSVGGYLLIRAEQRVLTESAGTPFPRVLSPAGYYGDRYADLSIAEFRNGVLVQTEGQSYGRSVLDEEVQQQLQGEESLWLRESIRDRTYQTYYLVKENIASGEGQVVTAVRRRTTNVFDQLYHLLRIIVAGLILAFPVYIAGLFIRWRRPEPKVQIRHFRDRVLNAFFSVGIITVVAMGVVGLRVVTGENERAIESWLRQHLDRVEETLELEARGEELPYRVLDRMSVDSLAARVGLDLVVYHNLEVEQASRPELIRDRLIERRLPVEAFEALYFDGFRFVTVDENLGTFAYTAGYRAMTDERGTPHYVVSIPTLPEQERIEEERARTVAYLFGALLLLVLVVMVTASLLANALTRPIAQLRAGLQAVAAGHFERISKVDSGDEIADLVDSFNTMQDQLQESRSLLSQQERQLAWREMARQVAHEIKNPLTPMKLSIQHLRAAFLRKADDGSEDEKFSGKFSQTTTTLIEQIDTLARIANEFSSFGRMPTHIREEIDLNEVIMEAVGLMAAEENVTIETDLHDMPLVVSGDREALRRVYVNFIKNAIQAVPDDREALITVSTVIDPDATGRTWAIGRVADNGSGIPRNLWDKIFVPSFSTKTSGTGLGLAIARKTVESMDGEIGFDTEFDRGTVFWIRVPLVQSEALPD